MSIDELYEDIPTSKEEILHDAVPVEEGAGFRGFQIPEFLKAKTGPGTIENYIDHPMNFNNSKPVAQVLRGLTGMFMSLDYAVIDIVLGMMKMKPKKEPVL
jgi:hypothetical protein